MKQTHAIMFDGPVFFTEGYKYQLKETLKAFIPSLAKYGCVEYDFVKLNDGKLELLKGFASDGPSGLTIDSLSAMRGAFIHDGIYRLIRQGLLPPEAKQLADELLHDICVMDKMWHWRADGWYTAVDKFADAAADPKNKAKVLIAPRS